MSSALCIISLGLSFFYVLKLGHLIKYGDLSKKEFLLKYKSLFITYKDDKAAMFELVSVSKKIIFSALLVLMHGFSAFI